MAFLKVKLIDALSNILSPDLGRMDALTNKRGYSLEKFSELLTASIVSNVLRVIPSTFYTYLSHNATTRNNIITADNTYQNFNFGTTVPSMNQNNVNHSELYWLEFIKTSPELEYYDAIKFHLHSEQRCFLCVEETMYFIDAGGNGNDVYNRIQLDNPDGTSITNSTTGTHLTTNRATLANVLCQKITDGTVLKIQGYGRTTNTISRLMLKISIQELIKDTLFNK